MGFFNKNGKLKRKTIKETVDNFFGKDANSFNNECIVDKATPADTALYFTRCFRKWERKQPNDFGVGPKAA